MENGTSYQYGLLIDTGTTMNLEKCRAACAGLVGCKAADFDFYSDECYVHIPASNLFPNNSYSNPTVIHNVLYRTGCDLGMENQLLC